MRPICRVIAVLWGMGCATQALAADAGRYALLIGANRGQGAEPQLQYAVNDAQRMRDVLTGLGDFLPDNIVVLEEPSADRVRDALARVNARMRLEVQATSSLLFVYYSGHADSMALHLGSTDLPWDELRNGTVGSPATVRVLMVDACRSAAATRVKGIDVSEPFALPQRDRGVEGFALVSSAAAGESAQESEKLSGSFFTHHWVSGLRGAADENHDGVVTLAEAYRYAAQRTQASTAATLAGVQHPTYAYGLKGYSDLVLTAPGRSRDMAGLRIGKPSQVLLWYANRNGPLVAEANATHSGAVLKLPPGRYFVQQRFAEHMFEGILHLSTAAITDLDPAELSTVTYAQYVRKGGGSIDASWAVSLWGGAGTPSLALDRFSPASLVTLQASLNLRALTVDGVGFASYGQSQQPKITALLWGTGAAVGVRKMFDVGPVALGFGGRLGAMYFAQNYSTARLAPPRWFLAPLFDTVLRADWHVSQAFFIGWEGNLRVAVSRQDTQDGSVAWAAPTQVATQLGAGFQW